MGDDRYEGLSVGLRHTRAHFSEWSYFIILASRVFGLRTCEFCFCFVVFVAGLSEYCFISVVNRAWSSLEKSWYPSYSLSLVAFH